MDLRRVRGSSFWTSVMLVPRSMCALRALSRIGSIVVCQWECVGIVGIRQNLGVCGYVPDWCDCILMLWKRTWCTSRGGIALILLRGTVSSWCWLFRSKGCCLVGVIVLLRPHQVTANGAACLPGQYFPSSSLMYRYVIVSLIGLASGGMPHD